MQTYQEIIRRLHESQKIRLLTDFGSFADPELHHLGIPRVIGAPITEGEADVLPSPVEMARSWNPKLVERVSARASRALVRDGVTYVTMPCAKAAVGCIADSLSEDPYLSGKLGGALLRGAEEAGVTACLSSYGTLRHGADSRWSSAPPDAATLRMHLEQPFRAMLSAAPCAGVVVETGCCLPEGIADEDGDVRIIRRKVEDAQTVQAITRGEICLSGSAEALQSAMHQYRRLQSAIDHGKATTGELNAAVEAGTAISEETVDAALERLLSFAARCRRPDVDIDDSEDGRLADRAFAAATVLLENRVENRAPTLPLTGNRKICLVGDLVTRMERNDIEQMLQSQGHTLGNMVQGYDPADVHRVDLIEDAEHAAESADTVLLFLTADRDDKTRRVHLPANCLALFDRLSHQKKHMVVILSADLSPDVTFLARAANPPAAVLLAPFHLHDGIRRTLEILLGQKAPTGRLNASCVDHDDPANNRRGLPIGPFIGYRYYNTVGGGALYPFGHGLSYTRFRYSALKLEGNAVTFTVTNDGKVSGVTVPQVYVGISTSAVLRPRRELVGFEALELSPGEKKTVSIPLHLPSVFDEAGKMQIESGSYTVSVGESVEDIRLSLAVRAGTDQISPDEQDPADYLPSLTNIRKDHYTLEAEYTPMKPSLRNALFGIAALAMAAAVKIFDIVARIDSIVPDIFAIILAVGAIVFLALDASDRKKMVKREQKQLEEINALLYGDGRRIPAPTADQLFADAHDPNGGDFSDENSYDTSGEEEEYDLYADVDQTMTFASASEDFARLCTEKGLHIDVSVARSLFASLATSRLVVVRDMKDDCFNLLLTVLSEYLDCPACVDTVDETYVGETAVLFSGMGEDRKEQQVFRAIMSARNRPRHMHVAALNRVTLENLSRYFVPFARYAAAPHSAGHVVVQDPEGRDVTYSIPANLWFILNLKEGETLGTLPDYIADIATVHTWAVTKSSPAASCSEFRQFYFGQMQYLCDRVRADVTVDEDLWKKLDRLEAFAGRYAEFHIGNKAWLGLELYLAVLTTCEVELRAALDESMAVKLIPALCRVLNGKIGRDERGLGETLDGIFGAEYTAACRRVVKGSGVDLM